MLAGLHSIRVIGRETVGLLLGIARRTVFCCDHPILVPRIAIHITQVVPNRAIVVERGLELHNVAPVAGALTELNRPSVLIGELGVLELVRIVSSVGLESVRLCGEATVCGRNIVNIDVVRAFILDNCLTDAGFGTIDIGKGRGYERCERKKGLYVD